MRLLHTVTSIAPQCGGPTESLRQFTLTMSKMGHYQEVTTVDSADKAWVHNFPVPTNALGPRLGHYSYSRKLSSWLLSNAKRFDSIIIHGIWQYQSLAVWQASRKLGFPYFVFPHGALDPWFNQAFPLKRLKKSLYWPWGQHPVLRDAKSVLFTTQEEMLLARNSFRPYNVKETVVGYGICPPQLDERSQSEMFLQAYPHLRGERILLFLSRIHIKKGCDLLIRAFSAVAQDNPNLHLVIAGPDQEGLASQLMLLAASLNVADRITWPGMLTGDLKWGAYLSAEAFVLPSHSENFGIVVTEALACGKPVLITNKVNIWREVSEDGAGLVEADNEEGVTSMLKKWLSLQPQQKESMAERARTCFSQRFNLQEMATSFIKTIESHL